MKSTEVKTYDIGFYYGEEYSRLIMKDDKPLDDKEKKKEDEKLEKFLAKLSERESGRAAEAQRTRKKKNARKAAHTGWTWPMLMTSALWAKKNWKA